MIWAKYLFWLVNKPNIYYNVIFNVLFNNKINNYNDDWDYDTGLFKFSFLRSIDDFLILLLYWLVKV